MQVRATSLKWGLLPALVLAMWAFAAPASAQPRGKADKGGAAHSTDKKSEPKADPRGDKNDDKAEKADTVSKNGKEKVKNFDFNGLDLNGRMRTPQLLYFLERANEELERASLEKRSFIPHMVKSVEEESL
jgi:hypothetical protein